MPNHISCFISFCLVINLTYAQKDLNSNPDTAGKWYKSGFVTVNISQSSFTNWAAGGINALSANIITGFTLRYQENNNLWENSMDASYGVVQQGKNAYWLKTDDKIDLSTKYGRKITGQWHYASLVNFRTQMAPAYLYPADSILTSDFLAPAYLTGSIGLNYSPDTGLSLFLSPASSKLTIVNNQTLSDAGAFGVKPAVYDNTGNILSAGKKTRFEVGSLIKFFYSENFSEHLMTRVRLDLFSNYFDNPENIDVNGEMILAIKISRYFSFNITLGIIYDDDIAIAVDSNKDGIFEKSGPRTQFKEIMGAGLMYKH